LSKILKKYQIKLHISLRFKLPEQDMVSQYIEVASSALIKLCMCLLLSAIFYIRVKPMKPLSGGTASFYLTMVSEVVTDFTCRLLHSN
jgi:hypothetical protein